MPTRHRLSAAAACALALLLASVTPAWASFGSDVLRLINGSRAEAGLSPLTGNADMNAVARAWAEHLVATDTFEHNPDYAGQIPSGWSGAAENLAGHSDPSPQVMHANLMDSPGHRANILGDFTHIGIGIADADGGMSVLVEVFGRYPGSLPGDTGGGSGGGGSGGGSGGSGSGGGGGSGGDTGPQPTVPEIPQGWLGSGSTGPEVTTLQQDLASLGYDLVPDGDFGARTQSAVRTFQSDAGLRPDGLVGPGTSAALDAAVAAAAEPASAEPPDTASSEPPAEPTPTDEPSVTTSPDILPTSPPVATSPPAATDESAVIDAVGAGTPRGPLIGAGVAAVAALVALLGLRRRLAATSDRSS